MTEIAIFDQEKFIVRGTVEKKRQVENTNDIIHPSYLLQVSHMNILNCLFQDAHRNGRAKV